MSERFNRRLYINMYEPTGCDIHCLYANGANPDIPSDETHNNYEIIFFISGDVKLVSEFGRHILQPNTAIVLPPNTYHKLIINEDKQLYKRLIMGFFSVPELDRLIKMKINKFGLYQSDELTDLYAQLIRLFDSDYNTVERDAMFKAVFAQILINLDKINQKTSKKHTFINPMIQKTIEYINQNLDKSINVAELARKQNVSYSCLTSTFKSEMNTSVYNFILSKKLIMAAKKLSKGEKPMQVAIDCGFNDYSGFYKQYKKMFKVSPSSPHTLNKISEM